MLEVTAESNPSLCEWQSLRDSLSGERDTEAGGGDHQSLIKEALRQHIGRSQEPLEATLRRVIREEMSRAS